jgi:hypothetical protein
VPTAAETHQRRLTSAYQAPGGSRSTTVDPSSPRRQLWASPPSTTKPETVRTHGSRPSASRRRTPSKAALTSGSGGCGATTWAWSTQDAVASSERPRPIRVERAGRWCQVLLVEAATAAAASIGPYVGGVSADLGPEGTTLLSVLRPALEQGRFVVVVGPAPVVERARGHLRG